MCKARRMWINQPSTRQPDHKLHGTNVLAVTEHGGWIRVYFLSGQVESTQIRSAALSEGWKTTTSTSAFLAALDSHGDKERHGR